MDRLKEFKVLILDGDGVFFLQEEGWIVFPDGRVGLQKRRDLQDGQGLTFLRHIGIRVLFATAEGGPLIEIVSKLNNLPIARKGQALPIDLLVGLKGEGKKVEGIEEWLKNNDFSWSDCVYIGDDINDYGPMKKVALAVTPKNGTRRIKEIAGLVLNSVGGAGAIREFAEMVLDARGIDEISLSSA